MLGRAKNPYLILDFQDKLDLLHRMGVDYLVTEEFTPELQAMSHTAFAEEVLRERIAPGEIHVGYDFHFGQDRLGDWTYLRSFFADSGCQIRPHGAVRVDGQIVGCTRVRELVCGGEVKAASALLGRFHFVRGTVVRGRGRGRTLGFPTANVAPTTELVPSSGVYAVQLQVAGEDSPRNGIANLGFRPTFAEKEFAIEVHLFEADEDLYGKRVKVRFIQRVRDERKFDSLESLVSQIHRDVDHVRGLLPYAPSAKGEITWDPKPDRVS